MKQKVTKVIEDFEKKYDDATLAKMLFTQFNNSLRENQLPKIKDICDRFDKGELKYYSKNMDSIGAPAYPEYDGRSCTAAFLYPMFIHNQSIIKDVSGGISRDVNSNMNKALKADIVSNLQDAFNDALHFVPDVDINPTVNIDLSDISINSEWDINKIVDMTKSIFEDWFNYGDIYKDRTSVEKRRKFTVPFYKEQEAVNVNLPDELMQKAVKSLKDSIYAELTVENMARKCIFSIY